MRFSNRFLLTTTTVLLAACASIHTNTITSDTRNLYVPSANPAKLVPWLGQNGLYAYADRAGRVVIPPRFTDALPFTEERGAVLFEGKWGYIDPTGAWVVAPKYDSAHPFSQGRAMVSMSYDVDFSLSERAAVLMCGGWCWGGNKGYVVNYELAHDGQVLGEMSAMYASTTSGEIKAKIAQLEKNKVAASHAESQGYELRRQAAGSRDQDVKSDYSLDVFHYTPLGKEGVTLYFGYDPKNTERKKRYLGAFFDEKGTPLTPFVYSHPRTNNEHGQRDNPRLSSGLLAVMRDRMEGYINEQGTEVIAPQYDYARDFVGDFALVRNRDKKWAVINTQGEPLFNFGEYQLGENPWDWINATYMIVGTRRDGQAQSYIYDLRAKKIAFDLQPFFSYNHFSSMSDAHFVSAEDGVQFVLSVNDARKGNRLLLLDDTGKLHNYPTKESISAVYLTRDAKGLMAVFLLDTKGWSAVRMDGRELFPPRYTCMMRFENSLALVRDQGQYFYIDAEGKAFREPTGGFPAKGADFVKSGFVRAC